MQHPLRLEQLLSSFLEAFAFDASVAGMLLYAAAAPSGSATTFAPGPAAAAGETGDLGSGPQTQQASVPGAQEAATQPAAQHLAAGRSSVVMLPRMPLGLVLITTAATYDAVAAALRAAAARAAAADAVTGGSGTALRGLINGCLNRLQHTLASAGAVPHASRSHKRSRRGTAAVDAQKPQPELGGTGGEVPWQLQAASAAALLAEFLLGASPAWQPSWHVRAGAAEAGEGSESGRSSGVKTATTELQALAASVVTELVQEAIWALPTAAEAADSATFQGSPGQAMLLQAAGSSSTPGQQRLSAQLVGCNALLLKSAIECCGAAARALGPEFAHNGRLLRTALLPLLEKLGECWCLAVHHINTRGGLIEMIERN